jgi:glycosyltransferase involved in cell wall biosynthesis
MRVSVVIPCFNSLRFLPRTLDSVLAQIAAPALLDSFEVVLVDDGGSDDLTGWAARRGDGRVRVVRQDNAGVSAARNRGVEEAAGDLIAFCDSDDLWTPTTLARLTGCFDREPGLGLAYGWYDVIDASGRPTGRVSRSDVEGDVWEDFVAHNPVAASGVMVPRRVLRDVGGFAENRDRFRIDVEDWELWIRISAHWPVAVVREVVAHHRRHDSNSSADVESIEAAYRNLLDVVFAGQPPQRQRLRPLATGRIELRLASHWINDHGNPAKGLEHLERAGECAPELRRLPEYRRLMVTGWALRATGSAGHAALRTASRGLRTARTRLRGGFRPVS